MEVVILYGFICSGKSTIAKEYETKGYTIFTFDIEKYFFGNLEKSIKNNKDVVIDAPIWNSNNLAFYTSFCAMCGIGLSEIKIQVLPHLELNEVLLRVRNRWEADPSHINHQQFRDLNQCLEVIESRYRVEYQQIKFDS